MKYLLPILAALTLAQPADAQRYFGGSCAPVYHQPVYHAPVYQPVEVIREVIVPIFTPLAVYVDPRISYHYSGSNALTFAQPPFAAQQQFGGQLFGGQQPFGAAQLGNQFGAPAQQPGLPAPSREATSNESIDVLIDAIEKRVRQRQKGQAFEPPGPPPVPSFAPAREFTPKVSMLSVLTQHCAECHTGAKSKGSFVIFDAPGRLAAGFNSRKAFEAVRDGLMPPRERPRVPEASMQALKNF